MEKNIENNVVRFAGKVIDGPVFNHKTYGEAYYMITLGIMRKSGYEDRIRVIASDNLLCGRSPLEGELLEVTGQIRTYNRETCNKNKLEVTVFAKTLKYRKRQDFSYENQVCFEGFICKEPIRRTSPLGREICDLMIAVNRAYNKSDYIPSIAWGKNAYYCELLKVGDKVTVEGRFQSRNYRKLTDEGTLITKTAYEVSISVIEKVIEKE